MLTINFLFIFLLHGNQIYRQILLKNKQNNSETNHLYSNIEFKRKILIHI